MSLVSAASKLAQKGGTNTQLIHGFLVQFSFVYVVPAKFGATSAVGLQMCHYHVILLANFTQSSLSCRLFLDGSCGRSLSILVNASRYQKSFGFFAAY